MPNMSYCRMRNTALDLEECLNAIESGEYKNDILREEKEALQQILEFAHYIVNDLEYDIEKILDNDTY